MSRIGMKPVIFPSDNFKVFIEMKTVKVEGPLGELSLSIHDLIDIKNDGKCLIITRVNETKKAKSLHGLFRSLIANMVHGVTIGYKIDLQINGVGYRANLDDRNLVLDLGFSHQVIFNLPKNINANIDIKKTRITLSGIDKQLLGVVAAKIRSFRKPEPYKGKGIKYFDEIIKRKEGKSSSK